MLLEIAVIGAVFPFVALAVRAITGRNVVELLRRGE